MNNNYYLIYQGKKFAVEWYYDSGCTSAAREFYLALSEHRQAQFLALVKRICDTGFIKDIRKFRYEGDKIYAFKPQPERYLCFFNKDRKIIVTNAFTKKTSKLPNSEKNKSVLAKDDYQLRLEIGTYYETIEAPQK